MAAAEYYSGGQTPPQSRPHLNTHATPPYPMSDAPPPYSSLADSRPHSQPPPARPASDIYRPYPPNNSQYPPEKHPRPPPPGQQYGGSYNGPPKQEYGGSYNQHQQSGYLQPPGPSTYNQGYTSNPSYPPQQKPHAHFRDDRSRDRSRSRDRDRSRHHRHHRPDSHHRPEPPKKHSSRGKVDTFIGAGGGALIGDAIFPGLGTLGGAILGGLGGHKVGKDKEKERRDHGSSNRTRGRSYSNDADYYYADEHRRGRKY